MMRAHVVVTGVGCVSALGRDLESSLANLYAGVIQPISPGAVLTGERTQRSAGWR